MDIKHVSDTTQYISWGLSWRIPLVLIIRAFNCYTISATLYHCHPLFFLILRLDSSGRHARCLSGACCSHTGCISRVPSVSSSRSSLTTAKLTQYVLQRKQRRDCPIRAGWVSPCDSGSVQHKRTSCPQHNKLLHWSRRFQWVVHRHLFIFWS